jgi:signal transduction histidine kinase
VNRNIYIQNGVLAIFSKIRTKLRFFNSIRLYMLLIFIVVGIVPLVLFSNVLLKDYEEKAVANRITVLKNQANILSSIIQSSGYLSMADVPGIDQEVTRLADIYQGKIVVVNNNLRIVKDSYGLEDGKYLVSEEVIRCFSGSLEKYTSYDRASSYVRLTYPITNKDSKEIMGVIVMYASVKDMQGIINSLKQRAILFTVTLSVVIVVFAIYFSGMLSRPLKKVVNSIDRISEGYLEDGVSIKGYYEIEKISDSFNIMISRLQKLENSRQEFVSNVSHELKTPITSIKVLADSLLSQEDTPIELYREFLVDITEEIERENKIINDLLSLVKLDKAAGDMNISSVNINELLDQILKRLTPIAKKNNIEIIYESFRPVAADVDEVKLTLAITNLIENAIKYNVEDGWVRISLNADHKYFFIKVSDSGIGIPEEALDYIFERFYRVDKARSRESGGTGLGLAITKSVIQMHRGAIKVYSKEGEGTTFNVRIPLNYIA